MSLSKPWKAMERRFAKLFNALRIWRQDFGEEKPDVEAHDLIIDTKCYASFSVIEMYVRCERKYREYANGRVFILGLFSRKHPRAGDFVLVPAKHYAELREKAGGDVR